MTNRGTIRSRVSLCLLVLSLCSYSALAIQPFAKNSPRVFIHYMGWYNDVEEEPSAESLRHWKFGHANQPLIGEYDSRSSSTITYHILLAWASGIDGLAINVKDDYDHQTMLAVIETMKYLRGIDENFQFDFAISYDDQGFGLENTRGVAISKMRFLRDSILPSMENYAHYGDRPVIFSFDYPNKFITDRQFSQAIDAVFKENSPLLMWNVIEAYHMQEQVIGAYYPWVQPGKSWDKKEGLNWGDGYLKYFYEKANEIGARNGTDFICGGVWPGFDDRKNTSWGGNRYMDRQGGEVYNGTWSFIHDYNKKLPMEYIVIETWNDWNEGTEIEPSVEDRYKYLELTAAHIQELKGVQGPIDTIGFDAARAICHAAHALEESGANRADVRSMEKALKRFMSKEFKQSRRVALQICRRVSPGLE